MDMISGSYLNTLSASLQSGEVTLDEIEEAVRRILRIKHRAGLFEQPFTDTARAPREILTDQSRQLARQFARECMVLLKNDLDILPLKGFNKILH